MEVKRAVLILFDEFQRRHRRPLWVVRGIGLPNVFGVDVLRPGKAKRFEVTTHPAFVVLELGRSFSPGTRVFGNVDPFVFAFLELREIQVGREMEFPDKPSGVTSFTENISNIHVVAFQCDIEIGKPLILFAADRRGITFTI